MKTKDKRSTFLGEVASDLYHRYGAAIGELNILFPSRRARIFFTDAIAQIATEPVWEPQWVSIDELMSRVSGVEVGEHIRLVTELFKVYKQYHANESIDKFYHWGEVLLADFDMVDKYMIDVEDLFRNISDIKELETDLSYLTPEQSRIVAFWSSIYDDNGGDLSRYKLRFLAVWRSLLPIYKDFRKRLMELGIAYPGMVHRIAAERIKAGEAIVEAQDRYVVAGFNALSECEKVLFKALKSGATTHFYWDWDRYYSDSREQEAGLFIEKNRFQFPAALETSHDNLSRSKWVEAIACSSSVLQCKYVANILDDIVRRDGAVDKRTAIVLTDESLLLPLLYSLPEGIGKVNVTMGYPLKQSLAYSFVERLLELQHHARTSQSSGEESFYHLDVVGLLSHPYLAAGVEDGVLQRVEREIDRERLITLPASRLHRSELLCRVFRVARGWQQMSEYLIDVLRSVAALPMSESEEAGMRVEFLSYIIDNIVKLQLSIEECGVELQRATYLSLLRRHLQPLRIPFEGEPLEGLQIMGILETRTLDFDNVIILSMSDDNFPGSRALQPSYIPYGLRSHFELPTPEHHDGVYAYYFYRLIQRAESLQMLYCSRADDKSTGEQSRYVTQLEMESPFDVERIDVGVDVNLFDSAAIEIEKSGVVAEQLRRFCEEHEVVRDGVALREIERLSPTALFQYVACPLRFYYKSIANIRIDDELSEQVDAPMFGNILHETMQKLYEPLVKEGVDGAEAVVKRLRSITRGDVEAATDGAIRSKYLMGGGSAEPLSGNLILVREVVVNYILNGVLRYDIENPPQRVLGVESREEVYLDLTDSERIRLHGICDRVDLVDGGALRIVDYKTGTPHLDFAGVEQLFNGAGRDRQSNIFQTLLYSYMLRRDLERGAVRRVTPALYYVRAMHGADYSPLLCDKSSGVVEEYEPLHEEFEVQLRGVLTELFDESVPFRQCDDVATCEYCDFAKICRR